MSCSMRESAAIEKIATGERERGSPEIDRERAARRIGIIDQGVLIQDLFKRGLELAGGFEIITAATVEEWLSDASASPVELIVICLREGQSVAHVRDKMQALNTQHVCPVAVLADREAIDAGRVTWLLEQGAHGFISTEMPLEAAVHILRMVSAADR